MDHLSEGHYTQHEYQSISADLHVKNMTNSTLSNTTFLQIWKDWALTNTCFNRGKSIVNG